MWDLVGFSSKLDTLYRAHSESAEASNTLGSNIPAPNPGAVLAPVSDNHRPPIETRAGLGLRLGPGAARLGPLIDAPTTTSLFSL
ncbi:hypothetical protein AMTR_s00021p00128660 [Amborella trichopoda]|uniref:Uncharacterized protein n=1 Tax=Amborella trichopoda TaxID=13333 RepID=W1Q0Z6_AMBTC|nr:hypothetical protein AMTR_s00021p00128660 [Amborella trichopoda]